MVSYSMFLFPNLIRSFNKCFLQIKKKQPQNLLIITCVYVCVCAWVYMPESPQSTGSQLESEGCFPLWQIFSNVILLVSQRKQVDF